MVSRRSQPMVDATAMALQFLRLYGPLVLCLFTFLETSMLFPFLPSEVIVPAAAALLITDPVSFVVFVLAAGIGGTVGAFVPFYVFRDTRVGSVNRIKNWIVISEERIEQGQEWFQRWGQWSVFWGRFLPALRSVVSIPAGFANMNPRRFGVFTATGTVGFYAATGALIYYGRQQPLFETVVTIVTNNPVGTTVVLLILLGTGVLIRRWAHH